MRLIYEGGLAIASNVALSLLLALFPFLMFVASLLRLYGEAAMAHDIVAIVLGSWPGDSAEAIADQVRILLSQSPENSFRCPLWSRWYWPQMELKALVTV